MQILPPWELTARTVGCLAYKGVAIDLQLHALIIHAPLVKLSP